ncbi:MAG TPA: ABC transporter ATP-binding protein [Acidimicrobiia bacterium]|nr:ABC transporter ATP-binding protein [Acidimicrobiia bacterium]
MLEVRQLRAGYGPIVVLRGVDLTVGTGEIVAMIGPNGAGKSTTLGAIAGMLPRDGDVLLDGEPLPAAAEKVVQRGVALVPQGRKVFWRMTVEENLFMGAYPKGVTWKDFERRAAPVFDIFPRLAERRAQAAGSLSGGEQQMLVIGRALLAEPAVILIDELSLGLAPLMVETLLETIVRFNRELGTACLLVEQAATAALEIASSAYLLRRGEVVYHGPATRLREDVDALHGAYFGTSNGAAATAPRR